VVTPLEGYPVQVELLLYFLSLELELVVRRPFFLNACEVKAEGILGNLM